MADFSDVDAFSFHHGKLVLFVVHVRMLYGGDHRHGFLLLHTCSFPEFLRCWFIVVQLQEFIVIWRKGMYNLADFFTEPLSVKDHQSVMHLLVRVPSSSPALHTRRAFRAQRWRNNIA